MENKVVIDFSNPLFGKLEFDESLNCQLAYDTPYFEPRHFDSEDDGQLSLKTNTDDSDDVVYETKDGGEISSDSRKGIESISNTKSVKDQSRKPVVASTVLQHGDVPFKQDVSQEDANIAEMSVKLMDVSCGKELSKSVKVASPKLLFSDREFSDDGKQKPNEKINMSSGKVECHVCHKRLWSKTKLKIHHRIHTDERPFPCTICKQSFRQRGNLAEHISRLHKHSLDINVKLFVKRPGPEGFRCCFCLQLMKSREIYQKHISGFHADLLPMIQ